MPMPGQASGGFVESSSALRILYVGYRNTFSAKLTTDGFTQTNPPVVTAHKSAQLSATPKYGVLSASVAFTRPDAGEGFIGGPLAAAPAEGAQAPLGLFINDAEGNAYENTPGPASGHGPYVSGQGTMGSQLFETLQQGATGAGVAGDDLVYASGMSLYASVNGYLTSATTAHATQGDALDDLAELEAGAGTTLADATILGIVKIAPDSSHGEIVFDLRV